MWTGLLLAVVLTVYFVAPIEWDALTEEFKKTRLGFVALAVVMLLCEFGLRAVRWKLLLRRLAPDARVLDLFSATVIGAAANSMLPARAGEIAKPLVASHKIGVPFTSVIATAVLERVFDLLGLVTVLLAMSLTLPDSVGVSAEDAELVGNLKKYGSLAAAAAMAGLGTFLALTLKGGAARGVFEALLTPAPPPVRRRFLQLFDGFVDGLASVRDPGAVAQAALISLVIWFNGAGAIFMLFKAFSLSLPFGAACFTTVAIAVAVVLPQAPGFLGVFPVAIEKTLMLWSVDPTPAKAFAIVFWGVSFIPVTLVGLVALWREGLSLRSFWRRPDNPPE